MSARYRQQLEEEEDSEWSQDLPSVLHEDPSDTDPVDDEVADETLMAGKIPEKRRYVTITRTTNFSRPFHHPSLPSLTPQLYLTLTNDVYCSLSNRHLL